MFEFWNDFLHDKTTFGITIWTIFIALVLIVMFYKMWRDA